jgi:hypothetical protein
MHEHAILIQKSTCPDSIVSNSNSTGPFRRLFQQHRPKAVIGRIEISQCNVSAFRLASVQLTTVDLLLLPACMQQNESASSPSNCPPSNCPIFHLGWPSFVVAPGAPLPRATKTDQHERLTLKQPVAKHSNLCSRLLGARFHLRQRRPGDFVKRPERSALSIYW